MYSTMNKWVVGLAIVVAFVGGAFLATKLGNDDTTATDPGTNEDLSGDTNADGTTTDGAPTDSSGADPTNTDPTTSDPAGPDGSGLQTIPGTPTAVAELVSTQTVLLRSMGPIQIGMSVRDAEAAIGGSIIKETGYDGQCNYGSIYGDPDSPSLMIISEDDYSWADSRIERIDVHGASETRSGIHIGSSTDDVYAAYGDAIVATPHPYDTSAGSFYLTYVPTDPSDADYRLVMETSGNVVTEFRIGYTGAAEQIEGCS